MADAAIHFRQETESQLGIIFPVFAVVLPHRRESSANHKDSRRQRQFQCVKFPGFGPDLKAFLVKRLGNRKWFSVVFRRALQKRIRGKRGAESDHGGRHRGIGVQLIFHIKPIGSRGLHGFRIAECAAGDVEGSGAPNAFAADIVAAFAGKDDAAIVLKRAAPGFIPVNDPEIAVAGVDDSIGIAGDRHWRRNGPIWILPAW